MIIEIALVALLQLTTLSICTLYTVCSIFDKQKNSHQKNEIAGISFSLMYHICSCTSCTCSRMCVLKSFVLTMRKMSVLLMNVENRNTREGWPLLTAETDVNGDSKRTNERGSSLVGSLGCRAGTGVFLGPQSPGKLGRQPCRAGSDIS
jgi:hypothetical protein